MPPESPPGETPPRSEQETRGYVVLVEATPYDADRARWDTVLRGEFSNRDEALEAGRARLEREERAAADAGEEVVGSGQDRRFVAVPMHFFKPRIARVKRTESLVWEDA